MLRVGLPLGRVALLRRIALALRGIALALRGISLTVRGGSVLRLLAISHGLLLIVITALLGRGSAVGCSV